MTNPAAPSIPRRDHATAVERLLIPVDVPAVYGAAEQYADDLEYIAAIVLALRASGIRRETLARRLNRAGAFGEMEPLP